MRYCQGKCKLDKETNLCSGCQRSPEDIKQAYKEFLTRSTQPAIMTS